MASQPFLVDINLNGNALVSAGFEPLAVAPGSPFEGQIYFNTTTSRLLYWDGAAWVDPSSVAAAITAIDSPTAGVTVDDSDKTAVTIDIASASSGSQGLLSSVMFDLLNGATDAATPDTLAKRSATGTMKVATPVDPTDATNKAYVDTLVSSGMTIKGATDASTNPDYPAAIVGDTYHISAAGKIGGASGEDVDVGDVVICVTDSAGGDEATVGAEFVIVQRNDFQATTTTSGNVRFADAGEVAAGTATDVATTPADVATMIGSGGSSHTETLTAGSTSYTVTHNLGGTVQVTVYEKTTGDVVMTDVSRTDDNVVVISVNTALATDHAVSVVYGGPSPA